MSFPAEGSATKSARAWAMKELFSKFWNIRKRLGATIFQGLVWLGKPEPTQTHGRRGPPAQATFGKLADVFTAPHHQCRDRGLELKNPEHQVGGSRLRNFKNYRIRILFFCGKLNSIHYDVRRISSS